MWCMRAAPAVNIFFMENEEPLHYVQELSNCRSLEALQAKLQSTDSRWLEEFIEVGGLDAIVNCLTALCCRDEVDYEDGESLPQLQCIGCLKAAMNHQYGMECLIKRPGPGDASLLSQMALELETDNILVKIHLFLVFSAVSKHSAEGLRATMHALDCYKLKTCQRHRYSILVQELSQTGQYPEYQATIMAFINYLLSSCDGPMERMRLRSQLNGLDFADVLSFINHSDSPALLKQVQLYKSVLQADQEQFSCPGGVDISDHHHLFTALLEKVYATPNVSKLLKVLQNMLLIGRDSPVGDLTWSAVERMVESALKISSEQQAERVCMAEIDRLRQALEEEAKRKKEEGERTGGEGASSSVDVPNAAPPPGPPAPPPPPPPGQKKKFEIRSIFDRARFYEPKKRMKKLNWDKASDYDAKLSAAVWHGSCQEGVTVGVVISEKHIETLFCQKMDATDGKMAQKPKKVHLPDHRKALNLNLVLDGMKRVVPDPSNPSKNKTVTLNDEQLIAVVRDGLTDTISLNQAMVLMEQAPNEKDTGFLQQYQEDQSLLGRVERYMLNLLNLEAHPVRLRLLRTRKVLEELEEEYSPTFTVMGTAIDELMRCESLKNLFHIILLIGNFINGNSRLGGAYGFKVSSLPRLSATLANVRKTTLNVNFLHYLVTVCENSKECSQLLDFHNELPHLDRASRVSMDAVKEELEKWEKEIKELKELMKSKEQPLPSDLTGQMESFIPTAEATLYCLEQEMERVRDSGHLLAQYLCDDRTEFLDAVFNEIRQFVDEFIDTVKETTKEKPITYIPDHITQEGSTSKPTTETLGKEVHDLNQKPRGLNRATSIITEHKMELPHSLTPISEDHLHVTSQKPVIKQSNPFLFPVGKVQSDSDDVGRHVVSSDIVITDIEGGEEERKPTENIGINFGNKKPRENLFPATTKIRGQTTQKPTYRWKSSANTSDLRRPSLLLSRQTSWNEYKALSSDPRGKAYGGRGGILGVNRYLSVNPQPMFEGGLEDVAQLLHKMAEVIEQEINPAK